MTPWRLGGVQSNELLSLLPVQCFRVYTTTKEKTDSERVHSFAFRFVGLPEGHNISSLTTAYPHVQYDCLWGSML